MSECLYNPSLLFTRCCMCRYSKPVAAVVAVYCLWELLVFLRRDPRGGGDAAAVGLSSYLKIILDVVSELLMWWDFQFVVSQ